MQDKKKSLDLEKKLPLEKEDHKYEDMEIA